MHVMCNVKHHYTANCFTVTGATSFLKLKYKFCLSTNNDNCKVLYIKFVSLREFYNFTLDLSPNLSNRNLEKMLKLK